jgi:hypothetical protein
VKPLVRLKWIRWQAPLRKRTRNKRLSTESEIPSTERDYRQLEIGENQFTIIRLPGAEENVGRWKSSKGLFGKSNRQGSDGVSKSP